MSNRLLDEAIAKINEAKTFMATEHLVELEPEVYSRLGLVTELAQGHTDEEISYSDVVGVLLNMATEKRTATELATIVYKKVV